MSGISQENAETIVSLFKQHRILTERLNAIENTRARGTSFSVSFMVKNKIDGWGDEVGFNHKSSFHQGELDDIAVTVLARVSEQVAMKRKLIEHQLRELGADVAVTTA